MFKLKDEKPEPELDCEESTGRLLSVDKEWPDYRLGHADVHCQRVHAEMCLAEEKCLRQFQVAEAGSDWL